jgi:hypothetical protein
MKKDRKIRRELLGELLAGFHGPTARYSVRAHGVA